MYMGSPAYPLSAPRLAKIQHGSLSCFGLPSFNMAGRDRFLSMVTQEFVRDRFVPGDTDGFISLTRVLRRFV